MPYINPNNRIVLLTAEQHNRIVTLCGQHQDLVALLNHAPNHFAATPDQVHQAVQLYGSDDINIDESPYTGVSETDDGDVWVQAWVFVSRDDA